MEKLHVDISLGLYVVNTQRYLYDIPLCMMASTGRAWKLSIEIFRLHIGLSFSIIRILKILHFFVRLISTTGGECDMSEERIKAYKATLLTPPSNLKWYLNLWRNAYRFFVLSGIYFSTNTQNHNGCLDTKRTVIESRGPFGVTSLSVVILNHERGFRGTTSESPRVTPG